MIMKPKKRLRSFILPDSLYRRFKEHAYSEDVTGTTRLIQLIKSYVKAMDSYNKDKIE